MPLGARYPLVRPEASNEVCSMDLWFDRGAEGQVIKCLTIIDDTAHESVAIVAERTISGEHVPRILDHSAATCDLPQVIRTDNEKELCSRPTVIWDHAHTVTLRQIKPRKPDQDAYIESFNGRFRDECLNKQKSYQTSCACMQ